MLGLGLRRSLLRDVGGLPPACSALAHGFEELGGGSQAGEDFYGAEVEREMDFLGYVGEVYAVFPFASWEFAPGEAEADFEVVVTAVVEW